MSKAEVDLLLNILVLIFLGAIFWGSLPLYLWIFSNRIRSRSLEVDGSILKVEDAKGKEIARLDLGKKYEVEYFWKGYFWALYTVSQNGKKFHFSSRSRGAEHVIRDVFKMEWPPVGQYPGLY